MAYTWDANKNKLSEVLTGVNATVNGYGFNAVDTTYDFEDRLTQWKRANGAQNQSWSLTAVGDWQSQTVNGTATNRTHGPTHELTAIGASSLSYDAKGNLTQDTSRSPTQNYVWDYDNKMKSADIDGNGSADVSFEYDALGRRVARTQGADAVVYFQVEQQTICDYPRGGAAASPTNRYYWGSYIDELIARKATGTGGAVLFAHRNQQYSIYAYSNSSGAVVERIAYTAYGQPTFMNAAGTVQSTSPNSIRYSYTGREWDASLQLHHFRARWMGPHLGRQFPRKMYISHRSMYFYSPLGNDRDHSLQSNDILTITRIGPIFTTRCGGFATAVRFAINDPTANGWLVQCVYEDQNMKNCKGKDISTSLSYCEMWYVENGVIYTPTRKDKKIGRHKVDLNGMDDHPNSVGCSTKKFEVAFLRDYDPKFPPWVWPKKDDLGPASGLPYISPAPNPSPVSANTGTHMRAMHICWDCCKSGTRSTPCLEGDWPDYEPPTDLPPLPQPPDWDKPPEINPTRTNW